MLHHAHILDSNMSQKRPHWDSSSLRNCLHICRNLDVRRDQIAKIHKVVIPFVNGALFSDKATLTPVTLLMKRFNLGAGISPPPHRPDERGSPENKEIGFRVKYLQPSFFRRVPLGYGRNIELNPYEMQLPNEASELSILRITTEGQQGVGYDKGPNYIQVETR